MEKEVTKTNNNDKFVITKNGDLEKFLDYHAKNVDIPEGTEFISYYVFENRTSLESVNFPNSLTEIGFLAFGNCSSLKNLVIPDSVKYIDSAAFDRCSSLSDVKIGNNVTDIGSCAFKDCSSLEEAVIPESVKKIDFEAFSNCTLLKSVVIEGNPELGEDIFKDCDKLKEIIVRDKNMKKKLKETDNIPKGCRVKVVHRPLEKNQIHKNLNAIEDLRRVTNSIIQSLKENVSKDLDTKKTLENSIKTNDDYDR